MQRNSRLIYKLLLVTLFSFCLVQTIVHAEQKDNGTGKTVYIIPIEKEVERGLEAFLKRTTTEAMEEGADQIVFEIDTPGGRVDSAGQIGRILQDIDIPTNAFIVNQALSAGSYIALNTDKIYMKPQATFGASGIITGDGNAADKKAQSAWLAAMRSAAESKGRDPLYAAAMADPSIDLPDFNAGSGNYLTLDPKSALAVGYADGIVKTREELLNDLGLANAKIVERETTFAEEVARFVTNPIVIPILLSVASLGLIVELYSPGFGVPGSMGLISLGLFFYGHFVAGLAGMEAIILLILGIALIIAEFFVPGGILGALGVAGIVASLLMSGYDVGQMAISITIAFVLALIVGIIMFKVVGVERGLLRKVILKDRTSSELGYVSVVNRYELIDLEGIAMTTLRPSGTGLFNEERIDVVTEGAYIEQNKPIKVIAVEGVRIVVREVKIEEEI